MTGEDAYVPGNPALSASGDLVVISGCSGGGKSSLLHEMSRRGFPVFPEPGRQIVKEELFIGGGALPWLDLPAFLRRAFDRAVYFFNAARPGPRPVLFDRSTLDCICALEVAGSPIPDHWWRAVEKYRYHRRIFLAPPWREIFVNDPERRHDFGAATREFEALTSFLPRAGYGVVEIPKGKVAERADFLEAQLLAERSG